MNSNESTRLRSDLPRLVAHLANPATAGGRIARRERGDPTDGFRLLQEHGSPTSRSSILAVLVVALALALCGADANAATFSFGDTANYWSGFSNGTSDDGADAIGVPNITGGRAILDPSGDLTRVEIDYTAALSPVASGTGHVIPGDLFLDAGADGSWDYVLQLVASADTAIGNYGSATILDISAATPSFILSGSDNTGHWAGYLIRDAHPYAWSGAGTAVGTGSLDPFNELASGGTLGFNLGTLAVGTQLRIGWAVSCANDVLYQSVAVPESSTVLLMTSGLLGLTVLGRPTRA